jgi:serine/threonine protein kinase
VLIVHLLTGATPFASLNDDELRIYKRITRAQPALPPGADISPESQDLVRQLLVRDPTKRLGQVRRVAAGGRGVVMGRQLLA